MRRFAVGLFLVVGLVLAADDAKDKDLVKKEAEKLQGTWQLVELEQSGRKSGKDAIKTDKMVVTGDKYVLTLTGNTSEGVQEIDPGKKPKWINATTTKGEGKGQTYLGIYEVDGETYRECYAPPGRERPKEFKTDEAGGQILFVWKKAKDKDKEAE
jgi:uncharacterized protein (TIGR03067 family)